MSTPPTPAVSVRRPLGAEVFRDVVATAPMGLLLLDESRQIVAATEWLRPLFGLTPDEIVERSLGDLFGASEAEVHAAIDEVWAAYEVDAATAVAGRVLRRVSGQSTSRAALSLSIAVRPFVSGGAPITSLLIRRIGEARVTEATEQRSDQLLRSALETFDGAFAVFDEADKLLVCNSHFRAVFGCAAPGDIRGAAYSDLMQASLSEGALRCSVETRSLARPSESGGVGGAADADGFQQWLQYHQSPAGALDFVDADGRRFRLVEHRTEFGGTVCSALDVTHEVAHEAELEEARRAAQAASDAKTEFLASMSHELRTPLNTILGFSQLLENDAVEPLSARQVSRLRRVRRAGEHLLNLIDDVLDLERIESGHLLLSLEPVDLGEVFCNFVDDLEPVARREGIMLSAAAEFGAARWVIADRTRFSQILLNYGSNAIKYGRRGGFVHLGARESGTGIRISVRDDGLGIEQAYHEQIFQPFVRAGKETGPIEGTGIGLSICKRLAEQMHGHVGFSSVEGEGSTFWVELPRHDSDVAIETAEPSPPLRCSRPAEGPSGITTVVYVEDNPSNVALMREIMRDHYPEVRLSVAETAELGVELVASQLPQLVVMDLHLPQKSGFEAAAELLAQPLTAGIPIVALSAAVMPRDRARARAAGFFRYLTKPLQVAELHELFEALRRE